MTWCGRLGEMKEERPTILLLLDESSRSIAGEVGIGAEERGSSGMGCHGGRCQSSHGKQQIDPVCGSE